MNKTVNKYVDAFDCEENKTVINEDDNYRVLKESIILMKVMTN